jgi:uncharacterized membrane protein
MKSTIQLAGLFVLGVFILSSCTNDNEEDLYPTTQQCDTTNVSFAATILPIVQNQCQTCHSGAAPNGNFRLESYEDISAGANKIYGRTSLPADDPMIMPPGQKLDDCSIGQIKKWIEDETPNN